MEKITFDEYKDTICALVSKIAESGKQYKALFPIPRGGYYPAIMLSNMLHIPIVQDLGRDVPTLIVDDIVDSGKTLEPYTGYDKAVVYAKDYAKDKVTFYGEIKADTR